MRGPKWFRWKYVDNPYTDHIPVFVAEYDDKIVGARPFLAMRLRIGDQSVVAYQPADTMVAPNHRRAGVFRRLTAFALSTYRDRDPTLFFNFPNQHARPGYLDLGWRAVAPEVTYYRVETPTAVRNNGGLSTEALSAGRPVIRGYYAARKILSTPPDGFRVRRIDGAAIERLAMLLDRRSPPTIHADRTKTFLRWRLASPVWERQTYLVDERTTDGPVAALVARSRTNDDGLRLTQIVDIAPLCGRKKWREALWRGLEAVIETHPMTDLFAVSNGVIPHEVLAAFGFLPDDSFPVSQLTTFDSMLVTRPNGDPTDETAWQIAGRAIDEPDNWCVTFAERDTS